MNKISNEEMRNINGGATYTATEKCGLCGKKFSVTVSYNPILFWQVATIKTAAKAAVHKKVVNHYSKCSCW